MQIIFKLIKKRTNLTVEEWLNWWGCFLLLIILLLAAPMPTDVLATVYRQSKEDGICTIIHLLNATGDYGLEPGMTVPGVSPSPAFPALTKPLIFEITIPQIQKAYCVSLDYQEIKGLEVQQVAPHRYRITASPDCLEKYSLIYLLETVSD